MKIIQFIISILIHSSSIYLPNALIQTCDFEQYLNFNGECQPCPINCELCFGTLPMNLADFNLSTQQDMKVEQILCIVCKYGFYYDYKYQKCVETCQKGMRANQQNSICEICKIENCADCTTDINYCDDCNQNFEKYGSKCLPVQIQLVKQEKLLFNYYEHNQRCNGINQNNPSEDSQKQDCFSEVQNCPVLQNSLYNSHEMYQTYIFDTDGDSIFIFTVNSILSYSFPDLTLLKEKSLQRDVVILSCGFWKGSTKYLFCAVSQNMIISIDRKTLVISDYQIFQDSFFVEEITNNQFLWEDGRAFAFLGSNNGISVFDFEIQMNFNIIRDKFNNFFIANNQIFIYCGEISKNDLFLVKDYTDSSKDVLLYSQNSIYDLTGYIQDIIYLENNRYLIAGEIDIAFCNWNFSRIYEINAESCKILKIPRIFQYVYRSNLSKWNNLNDIIIIHSPFYQSVLVCQITSDTLEIIFESYNYQISGFNLYDNYLILLLNNGILFKYELKQISQSYQLSQIDFSLSIGISGLNTQTLGVSFIDRTLTLECLKSGLNNINCSSLLVIVNSYEIILINMNNQKYDVLDSNTNIKFISRHDEDIQKFLNTEIFSIEKQIGLIDHYQLDSALIEYTIDDGDCEMQLIVQKYLIRGNSKTDIKKEIMMSRLDQSGGSVIDSELFKEYNIIFLFHETGIIAMELVQFIQIYQFDIRNHLMKHKFNRAKKQRVGSNLYAISLQDNKEKYAFTLLLKLEQRNITQIATFQDYSFQDYVLNEQEFTVIKLNNTNQYIYRQFSFQDFQIYRGNISTVEDKTKLNNIQIIAEQQLIVYTIRNTIFLYSFSEKNTTKKNLSYKIGDMPIQFSSYPQRQNFLLLYLFYQDYVFVHNIKNDTQKLPQRFACEGDKKIDSSKNQNHNFDFIITNQQQVCIFNKKENEIRLQKLSLRMNVIDIDFFYFKQGQNVQGIIVDEDIDVIAVICTVGTYLFELVDNQYKQFFFSSYTCDKVKYLSSKELVCQQFGGKTYKLPLKSTILKNQFRFSSNLNDIIHLPLDDLLIFKMSNRIIVRLINIRDQNDLINFQNVTEERSTSDIQILDDGDDQDEEEENDTYLVEDSNNLPKQLDNQPTSDSLKTQRIDLLSSDAINGFYYDQYLHKLIIIGQDKLKKIIQFDSNGNPIKMFILKNPNYELITVFQDKLGILFHNPIKGVLKYFDYDACIVKYQVSNFYKNTQISEKALIHQNDKHFYILVNLYVHKFNYEEGEENQIGFKPSENNQKLSFFSIFVRSDDKQIFLFNQMDVILLNSDMILFEYLRFQEIVDSFQVFFIEKQATFVLSPLSQNNLYILKFCNSKDEKWTRDQYKITVINLQYNLYNIQVDSQSQRIAVITKNSMLQVIRLNEITQECKIKQNPDNSGIFQTPQKKRNVSIRKSPTQEDINFDKESKNNKLNYSEDYIEVQFNLTELLEDIVQTPLKDDEQILRTNKIIVNMIYPQDIIIIGFSNNLYIYSISKKRCLFIARNSNQKLRKIMVVDASLIMTYNQDTFYFWSLEDIIKYSYLQTTISSNVVTKSYITSSKIANHQYNSFSYFDLHSNQLFLVNSSNGKILKRLQLKADIQFSTYFYNTRLIRQRDENPRKRVNFTSIYSSNKINDINYFFVKQGYKLLVFNSELDLVKSIRIESVLTKMIAYYNQTGYFMSFLNTLVLVDVPSSTIEFKITFNYPFIILNDVKSEYLNAHPFINILNLTDQSIYSFNMVTKQFTRSVFDNIDSSSFTKIIQNEQIAPNIYAFLNSQYELVLIKQNPESPDQFLIKILDLDYNINLDSFYFDDFHQKIYIFSFSSSSLFIVSYESFSYDNPLSYEFSGIALPSYTNNKIFVTQDSYYCIIYSDWAIDLYIAQNMQSRVKIRQVLGESSIKQIDMIGHDLLMIVTNTEIIILVIHLSQSFVLYRLPFPMPQVTFTEWRYTEIVPRKKIEISLHVLSGQGYTLMKFQVDPSTIDSQTFTTGLYQQDRKQIQKCLLSFDLFYTVENKYVIRNLVESINAFNSFSQITFQITDLKINIPSNGPNSISKLNSNKKDEGEIRYESIIIASKNMDYGKLLINSKTSLGNLQGHSIRGFNITYIFDEQDISQNQQQQEDGDVTLTDQVLHVDFKKTLSFNKIQFIGHTNGFRCLYSNISEIFYVNQASFSNVFIQSHNKSNLDLLNSSQYDEIGDQFLFVNQARYVQLNYITLNNVTCENDAINVIRVENSEMVSVDNMVIKDILSSYLQVFIFAQINQVMISNVLIENVALDSFTFAVIDRVEQLEIRNLTIRNVQVKYPNYGITMIQTKGIFNQVYEGIHIENSRNIYFLQSEQYKSVDYLFVVSNKYIIFEDFYLTNTRYQQASIKNSPSMQMILNIQTGIIQMNNLVIQGNQFQGYLMSLNCDSIQIKNTLILQNNQQFFKYADLFIASVYTSLYNITIKDNRDFFIDMYGGKVLQIASMKAKNNIYSEETQKGLFNILEFKLVMVKNSQISDNYSNEKSTSIFIYKNVLEVIIDLSEFKNNTSSKSSGGAIKIKQAPSFIDQDNEKVPSCIINNTNFYNNSAPQGSGGAIFIQEVNLIIINSTFLGNKAMIGGAVRIKSVFIAPEQFYEYDSFRYNNTFIKNKADLFGQNIGFYPQKIKILNSQTNKLLEYLEIKDFRSGNYLPPFYLQYLDNEDNPINFKSQSNSDMSKEVQDEINSYLFLGYKSEFKSNISVLTLSTHPYSQNVNTIFVNISLAIEPGTKGKLILESQAKTYFVVNQDNSNNMITSQVIQQLYNYFNLKYFGNQELQSEIFITSRKCQRGEIYSKINEIYFCELCPEGKFSFNLPDKEYMNTNICKICPQEAVSCQQDKVNLKNGYWKESQYSEEIYQCKSNSDNCQAEDSNSIAYCSEGYIGPLCSSCDTQGIVWGYNYAKQQTGVCSKCNQGTYHILVLIFFVILSLAYFIFIVRQSQMCTLKKITVHFLRRMRMISMGKIFIIKLKLVGIQNTLNQISIGKSAQFERSSVLSKIFMSYVQVQIIIVTSSQKLQIPKSLKILQVSGDPIINVFYSLDCMLSYYHIQIVFLRIFWIFFFIFCILIVSNNLFIFQYFTTKSKSREIKQFIPYFHMASKIVLIYSFPSLLTQLVRVLTCIKYGTKTYCLSDLQFDCSSPEFGYYQKTIVIPLLIFIILLPIFFFWRARRIYTLMTQKIKVLKSYGFLFYGYRPHAYYWEMLKLVFKGILIILITIYHELHLTKFLLILITLIIYMQIQLRVKPYETYEFNYLDFQSHLACSLTLISILINLTTYIEWQIYLSLFIIIVSNVFFFSKLTLHYFHGYKIPYNPKNRNVFEHLLFYMMKYVPYLFGWIQVQKEYSFKILLLWHKLSNHVQQKKDELLFRSIASSNNKVSLKLENNQYEQAEYIELQPQCRVNPGIFHTITSHQALSEDQLSFKMLNQRNLFNFQDKKSLKKAIKTFEDNFLILNNDHQQRVATEGPSHVNFGINVFENYENTGFTGYEKSLQKFNTDIDSQVDLTSPTRLIPPVEKHISFNNSILSLKNNLNQPETHFNLINHSKYSTQTSYIQSQIKINREKNKKFSLKSQLVKNQQKDVQQSLSSGQDSGKQSNCHNLILPQKAQSYLHHNNEHDFSQNNFKTLQINEYFQKIDTPYSLSNIWKHECISPLENSNHDDKQSHHEQQLYLFKQKLKQVQLMDETQEDKISSQTNDQEDKNNLSKSQNESEIKIHHRFFHEKLLDNNNLIQGKDSNLMDLKNISNDSELINNFDESEKSARNMNQKHNLPISSAQVVNISQINDKMFTQK